MRRLSAVVHELNQVAFLVLTRIKPPLVARVVVIVPKRSPRTGESIYDAIVNRLF